AELRHYGFIALVTPHSLGVDGKGKAPHWRLTECGRTSRQSENGLFEPPTNDFLRWDRVLFDPKPYRGANAWDYEKQNPASHVGSTPLPTSGAPPFPTSEALKAQSASHGVGIEDDESASHVLCISSLTTTRDSAASLSASNQGETSGGKIVADLE